MPAASRLISVALSNHALGKLGRAASDWVDLELSLVRESLRYAAPRIPPRRWAFW